MSNWAGYDSNGIAFRATGSAQPRFYSSVAQLNNHPAVKFDGNLNIMQASGDATSWTAGAVLVVFCKTGAVSSYERLWDKQFNNGGAMCRSFNNANVWDCEMYQQGNPDCMFQATDGIGHWMGMRQTGSAFTGYMDGAQVGPVSCSYNTGSNPVSIGGDANASPTDRYQGYIGAVFYATRNLTNAEWNNLLHTWKQSTRRRTTTQAVRLGT